MSEEPIGKEVPITSEVRSAWDMSGVEFKEVLAEKTTPELIYLNAKNIYDFLSILFGERLMDSVMREWAFQWYSEQTGDSYDNIYNKWLED